MLSIAQHVSLDRKTFVRPIAHRGLHDIAAGRLENTTPAFVAGLARGFGVECDLQPANDGTPMVFHDATLERLLDARGRIDAFTPAELRTLVYRDAPSERMSTFAELLELAAGRGPLLVEIKSTWATPNADFLAAIAELARAYRGPLALMSFDPSIMAAMAMLAPEVPRGIISGHYRGAGWHVDQLGAERAAGLTHLLFSRPAAPSFYAYHVADLPTPVTRYVRAVQELPLFAWTVRTAADRALAAEFADAAIFEGDEPVPA